MDRRIGKFYITGALLRSDEGVQLLAAIQDGMAVVHIEPEPYRDMVMFFGVGPMFEPVKNGEITPLYEVKHTKLEGDEEETITFQGAG